MDLISSLPSNRTEQNKTKIMKAFQKVSTTFSYYRGCWPSTNDNASSRVMDAIEDILLLNITP